jgi:cytochrome c biogenesis protein CcdA
MLIYLLAFVGGALTILSPCILPVLPFVFAAPTSHSADQVYHSSAAWR